jgi:hypothetical protein
MAGELRREQQRRPVALRVAAVLGLALAIVAAGHLRPAGEHTTPSPVGVAHAAEPRPGAPFGSLDVPTSEAIVGPRLRLAGWALDADGPATVEVRVDDVRFKARMGVARPDVARAKPGFAGGANAGFEFDRDLAAFPMRPGADRRIVTVVAVGKGGAETVLGRRSLIDPAALSRWVGVAPSADEPFYLLPALSGVRFGGAAGLDAEYAAYESATVRIGMRVPILYMRTTRGASGDFAFDPDWDVERRCGNRRIAEDALGATLAHARAKSLPVLLTLNGGIWADAACDVAEWDVNDRLEQDKANCQWNEKNEVMPDDATRGLPGSLESPQLGRSLTFNVYATEVRRYKKRNLQQAARDVAAFMKVHPRLVVGVTLDPDTYINPFFNGAQWYDYNPGTLRQFRHWLAGTGPYAGQATADVPDLSSYRRAKPLTLAETSGLAGRVFQTWDEVDPPRTFRLGPPAPFWQDPWAREWEVFRRHLVQLHYDDLARWLVEAGIPRDRIWTAQGFVAPHRGMMPLAVAVDSPVRNFDSGGVSIEGAKPRDGHLGAILYGASALNDIRMDNDRSLFATFAGIDPGFAVIEFNTADPLRPRTLPGHAAGYRALREFWNAGARHVSPMAWNGSNGANYGAPGFVDYTAWRNTPLEEEARDFMLARAGLAPGSLLWEFGSSRHADDDGWSAETGTIATSPGALLVVPDANGHVVLLSPRGLALASERVGRVVAGLPGAVGVTALAVYGRGKDAAAWVLVGQARGDRIVAAAPGRVVERGGSPSPVSLDQLRVEITFDKTPTAVPLARIAVLPIRRGEGTRSR